MDKKRILIIGAGQCGNKICDLMLKKDGRYTGLFSNANLKDMENLKHFDVNRNVFYIPNATGTGKSRELASQYMKEEVKKLVDMILKYALQDVVEYICSADGGFGSGSLKTTVRAIKRACPNKSVNVVAIFPKLSEGEIAFKNTLEFWDDLINLKSQNLIDSIQIVDNNKRRTLEEINECLVEELDYTMGFEADNIDETDSKRINTAKGYKLILKLDDRFRDIDTAIDKAIKNSIFVQPPKYDCNYIGVSVKENSFNAEDVKNKFNSIDAPYFGYNTEYNAILLSGLMIPKDDAIGMIQMALEDIEKQKQELQESDKNLLINTHKEIAASKQNKDENNKIKSTISSKELNKMFDDNFWDD